MKNNKFLINFSTGKATTQNGNDFKIFMDSVGLKIFTNRGVVFLNEQNSEVI